MTWTLDREQHHALEKKEVILILPEFTFLFFFCASVLLMGQPALGVRNTKPRTWKIIALFVFVDLPPDLSEG